MKATKEPEARVDHATAEIIREYVRKHGGGFHGPRVEHLSMEEQAFYRMMADYAANRLALLQSSAPECRTAILAEREACAKIAERVAAHDPNVIGSTDERMTHRHAAMDVASAIRALPAPPGSLASRPAARLELIAQLEAVAGLAEKATPGPWVHGRDAWGMLRTAGGRLLGTLKAHVYLTEAEQNTHCNAGTDPDGPDAEFIAAVRSLPFAEIVVALRGRP